jgi:hypothetical protein
MIGAKRVTGRIAIAAGIAALALPGHAFATRYAAQGGTSAQDCATPATACNLEKAIEGSGGNLPMPGEEVIVLPGTYSLAAEVMQGASNLNIHGAFDQPRPVINTSGVGRFLISSATFSYLDLEAGSTSEALNLSGGTADRLLVRGTTLAAGSPVCQCYGGLVRDSVLIATGIAPALGVAANGGNSSGSYRNVTAYATNVATPPIQMSNAAMSGDREITAFNTIALNAAGGADVVADGPGSVLTFSHSNYRGTTVAEGGVIEDAPGESHQTAPPLFANQTTFDFSELANSPTIETGLSDPLNGPLDFAGNPRIIGSGTDIGAYEYVPPPPPSSAPLAFALGSTKVRIKPSGKGRLGFTCTSPPGAQCAIVGMLSAGIPGASRTLGRVRGSVPAGSSGTVLVKLNKVGRKRLAAKRKLRTQLSASVTSGTGLRSSFAASLTLKPKR